MKWLALIALLGAGSSTGQAPIRIELRTARATTITVSVIEMAPNRYRVIVKGRSVGSPSAQIFNVDTSASGPITVVYDGAVKVNPRSPIPEPCSQRNSEESNE